MTRFEKPIIVDEKDKPIPLAGQGFPYNDISSDRRFEELIYSIYKKKIENDTAWKTVYDDIALMQGVGEKGRDCVLYKNGAITGAIQCKKYKDRLTHPDCTKEILKFVLYSFFETTVLPDADNFTYYFAVSEGFSGPAADYLDKFNEEIVKEGELENWVNEVKTKYASLKNLDYKTILPELTKRLAAIKIRKILPQDLDMVLSASYCKAIIPLFFEVRTVTDNSKIDELISLVENRLPAPGEINVSEEDIVKQFETASLQLSSYRNDLHNIQNSHIQRQETTEVLGWVHRLLGKDEEPVLIVAGNPGYGKTVILKDVLVSLTDSKIPAIAIKADRYYAESVQELTEKLNLDHPLIKLVQKLRETQEMVVVIIDQIDSLSQSITSRRDYIDTYNQLIHQLRYIDGVRLIISIRTFDLNYDFEFSKFNQKQKIIVKELTEEQVRNVLMKLGLSSDNISSGLVKLLSVPNQLDIFCKIYRPGIVINQFHSLDDLYNELWRQKIGSQPLEKVQSLTSAVYEIADKINNLQQLSLAESHLTDIARQSLPYLESNGLIVQTNQTLQFFHQSYYDYVFARSFSEKDNSLIDYIFEQGQSIFIRPAVKMILSFLRAKDHADYVKMASSILFSNKVRYHLQLLVINQLGFEENPSAIEVDFVGQKLLNSAKWQLPFLESAIGAKWFPILKDSGVLDRLLNPVSTFKERLAKNKSVKAITKRLGYANTFDSAAYEKRKENYLNLWYRIVRRSLVENRVLVIDYLDTLPSSEEKNYRVLRLLHSLKKWDYPLAFSVFESCTTDPEKHWFDILNILETTLEYDYDWTVKQIERYLTLEADRSEGGSSSMYDHQMGSCLKKMFEIDRGKAFNFAIEFIKKLIKKNVELIKIDTLDFYQDGAYDLYDFERDHSHNTKELMLQQALDSVEILAKEGSAVFEEFESANKEENSLTILKILLVGLESAPKKYCRRGLSLLLRLIQGKAYDKGLQYWMGQLINAIYPYLQHAEKDKLNLSLLNLRSEYDFYIHAEGSKRSFFSHYGKRRFELLSMIPEHEIMNDPKLKGHFQELQRKFGKVEKKKPRSVRLMRIGPPLEDSAYEKMGLEHWENSFLEFTTDERINWGSDRGGLTQNYREFEAKIPGNVDFFLPLIEKIIREKK